MASKKPLKNANAIDIATRSQNLRNGLQKLGNDACLTPVRFRLVTPVDADPALIIKYANTCMYLLINFTYYNKLKSNYL